MKPKQTKGERVWVAVDRTGSMMPWTTAPLKRLAQQTLREHMSNWNAWGITIRRATLTLDLPKKVKR